MQERVLVFGVTVDLQMSKNQLSWKLQIRTLCVTTVMYVQSSNTMGFRPNLTRSENQVAYNIFLFIRPTIMYSTLL